MSQYKELAWALDTYDEDDKQRDQIAAILRGLDAQRPTVDEVMKLAKDACDLVSRHVTAIRERGDIELASMESFSAMENLRTAIEAFAAPVAAQPTEQEQSQFFCGVDFADGVLAVSVMRRRPDDVAEMIHSEQIEVAAQPQQAKPLSDAEFAINMLEMMFTAYENGTPCYEDPDDEVGFMGYAFRLADDDFKNIGDFLNRVRPVQSGIKEQG